MALKEVVVNGKIPVVFNIGDRAIDGITIKPMKFATFAEYISEAQGMRQPKTFEGRLRRVRMQKQVSYHMNGSTVPFTVEEILKIPIPAARTIVSKLDSDEGKPGKITRDGDGIDKAIVYELGTPLVLGQGKTPITELEFLAKTYGDIEDILAAPDSIQQAALLISMIAKPLGTTLSVLPSWAVTTISVADGLVISREILPRFLESPTES